VGTLALGAAASATWGAALLAPIGMLLAAAVARRRRRPLTRGASWIGAVAAVTAAIIVAVGIVLALTPPGTLAQIQRSADSASAARADRSPVWVERMKRGAGSAATDTVTARLIRSRAFVVWTGVMGGVLAVSVLGTIIGTLGWVAALPLAYALRGRWLSGSGSSA
jgi:hypothetical protein